MNAEFHIADQCIAFLGLQQVYDPRSQDLWDDDRKKEQLHWSFLFSNLIAQWAQWLGNALI